MKTIIITGTPGTGKSTLAKLIAKRLHFKRIDVSSLIKKKKISEGYDRKRKTKIVDTKKLNRELMSIIKNSKQNLIIDSHLSHYLPKKYVDLCIVVKCGLKKLYGRLKRRKYSKEKIRENLDAEIFEVCLDEARKFGHKIRIVDTTSKKEISHLLKWLRLNIKRR